MADAQINQQNIVLPGIIDLDEAGDIGEIIPTPLALMVKFNITSPCSEEGEDVSPHLLR